MGRTGIIREEFERGGGGRYLSRSWRPPASEVGLKLGRCPARARGGGVGRGRGEGRGAWAGGGAPRGRGRASTFFYIFFLFLFLYLFQFAELFIKYVNYI